MPQTLWSVNIDRDPESNQSSDVAVFETNW